jgi:diguanylate cyclase (GGDEF)-like protein
MLVLSGFASSKPLQYQNVSLLSRVSIHLWVLLCLFTANAWAQTSLERLERKELTLNGALYQQDKPDFPLAAQVADWRKTLKPVNKVNLLGGSYWFVAALENKTSNWDWVLDPYGTLIYMVDVRIFGSDNSIQNFKTGYQRQLPYTLHYGNNIALKPNVRYSILARFSSPYYASQPGFRVMPQEEYQHHVLVENVLTLGALGALICLGFYNFFIYLSTRDLSLFYYALYLGVTCLGWAFTFHIPTALFGWHDLRLHYIWFFLIPITNTLFYLRFLQVSSWSPLLARLSWGNIALSVLLLPSSFFAVSYMHSLATLVISIQLVLALICGIQSWRRGFRAAPYFVLAFIALLIPGSLILPANVGLIPDLVDNADLLTVLGTTLEGLLLAFALAERIRALQRDRDESFTRATQALALANTDAMTGIGNRHAFESALKIMYNNPVTRTEPDQLMLVMIDLDGLKAVNDQYGHARGDELLRLFAQHLKSLETDGISSYRLGGDEFTLIAQKRHESSLKTAIGRIEAQLREAGFADVGASIGIAFGSEHPQPTEVISRADARMYQNKAARKSGHPSLVG